jgi:hypothetical protein
MSEMLGFAAFIGIGGIPIVSAVSAGYALIIFGARELVKTKKLRVWIVVSIVLISAPSIAVRYVGPGIRETPIAGVLGLALAATVLGRQSVRSTARAARA